MSAVSLPDMAADGTCVEIGPDLWAVRGRSGWYRCRPEPAICSCESHLYRRARTVTPCRHLRALVSYRLMAEMVRLEFAAVRDDAPLPSDAELRRIFA